MTERGPIRPPSESTSLLIRITRNCPWNRCAFCSLYKETAFNRRPTEDILAEIRQLAAIAADISHRAQPAVSAGRPLPLAILDLTQGRSASNDERRVALWLSRGSQHVFLQDADSLVLPGERVLPILREIREKFPSVNRVTTYARTRTLCARSASTLQKLREAGLTRIHVGIESGSEKVLSTMLKGARPEHHIEGGLRARTAGFELTGYVMPGLGGVSLSEEHASETGALLRTISPHHVRIRTLWIDEGSPLYELQHKGLFRLPEEEQMVSEIQTIVESLRGTDIELISDHDRNLLPELKGHLTHQYAQMKHLLELFFSLEPDVRDAFVVARRTGRVGTLSEFLSAPDLLKEFRPMAAALSLKGNGSLVAGMMSALRPRSI